MFGIKTNPSLSRDFLLLSLLIIFILCLVSLWVAYQTYEEHADEVVAQLQSTSARIDRNLTTEIENASYILESLARQVSQIGPENVTAIAGLLRSFTNQDRPEEIFSWINAQQDVVVTSHRGMLSKAVDVSDRDYIKKALAEPWKVQIGRPVQGRVSEKWVLPICLGLTDYKGNHIGALLVSIDIDAWTQALSRDVRSKGQSFVILSRTLTPLTQPVADGFFGTHYEIGEKMAQIDFDQVPNQVLTRSGLFNRSDAFAYFSISARYPYIILVGYDQVKSFAEISHLLWARIVQILAVALFLLTLLWIIRTRIIRPVEALSEITAGITRGEHYHPLPMGGPLEIETLARHIKSLDDYLQERQRVEQELKQKNVYLTRIKDTTRLINQARIDFLSTLADELAKPVMAIREGVQTMKDQHFGPLGHEHYVQEAANMYRQASLFTQMIADIHLISDMEHGVVALDEKPVELSFLVHRALRIFHELPEHRHIEVKLRLDEHPLQLIIDEERFMQVLVNIFAAAAQQMEPSSPMVLECMLEKDHSGAEELLLMLKYTLRGEEGKSDYPSFEPYVAEGRRDTHAYIRSGGINLALTRMLVSLQQGRLEANISQNNVCRIYMRFPGERVIKPQATAES